MVHINNLICMGQIKGQMSLNKGQMSLNKGQKAKLAI